jgi:hypothetical protein
MTIESSTIDTGDTSESATTPSSFIIYRPDPATAAARRVYDHPYVFSNILSLLDRRDLARVIRIEQAAVAEVPEILYKEMDLEVAERIDLDTVS